MNILGISAYYHDSAAALIQDGSIIAAAQEERFTRIKHDFNFPTNAVDYCLQQANLATDQIDQVVFYEKPLLRFERLMETQIAYAPFGFSQFLMGIPLWLKQKLYLPREMDRALNNQYKNRYAFVPHHLSHAASAFFPSPFDEAAIITLDGVGEWDTTTIGHGKGNHIDLTETIHFPHSLGLLYSAFTYYTGFRVNSGEYKLMGLAPYGQPKYADRIRDKLIDIKPDGSFRLDMNYFGFCHKTVMTNSNFDKLFGQPARKPESQLTQFHMDIAASIQLVTEEIMLKIATHAHEKTGSDNLVLAGGVALNCVGNGKILRDGPFKNIWIQPAAGDAGGALGAALLVWYQLLNKPRTANPHDSQQASLLGPAFSNDQIKAWLDSIGAPYHEYPEESLLDKLAELIANENVIGHFHGRMEFGPRALGNRSIIGDARSEKMQQTMNLKIKFRESFRPFAPCVLLDKASEYFDVAPDQQSPYMLIVAPVKNDKRIAPTPEQENLFGIDKLNQKRSTVPAITHVDYSARLQTVNLTGNPRLYQLIKRFDQLTDCPVIINTSFNIRGEPIVATPEQAYRCFMATDMDVLVLENQILLKKEQPKELAHDSENYKAQFKLD